MESKHFFKLIHDLDPKFQVPSRKHSSTKLLQEKATEIQSLPEEQLYNNAEHIRLTVDLLSNRSIKGFPRITAHFILGWELKSAMIACRRFKGRHTGENILHEYEALFCVYDVIKHSVITGILARSSLKMFLIG